MYRTNYIDPMKSKAADKLHFAEAARFTWPRLLAIWLLARGILAAQTAVVSLVPNRDAFVSSMEPTSNYGGGGALSVSGSNALNGSGVQMGLFDTLMCFPVSNAVAAFDSELGAGSWSVTGSRLIVNEMASPDNALFNR